MNYNISNMKQAVFELFGVGLGAEAVAIPAQANTLRRKATPAPQTELVAAAPTPIITAAPERTSHGVMSYIAAGAVCEGALHADGDVEMVGKFKGDITAKGTVKLYSTMEGNVNAGSLTLNGCTLTGDASVSDTLVIDEGAEICGNVRAKEVRCAGHICGDLNVAGSAVLERTAQVHGNIVTGSFSVANGAVICGGLEIKGNGEK